MMVAMVVAMLAVVMVAVALISGVATSRSSSNTISRHTTVVTKDGIFV